MWLVCTGSIAGDLPKRLELPRYVVGRSRSADLVIKDSTLSRRHAELLIEEELVTVRDLGSLNGTYVNELPVEDTVARLGDQIRFGSVTCMLCVTPILPAGSLDGESTFAAVAPRTSLPSIEELTPAQRDVLRLVLEGRDDGEIAAALGRSRHTVHTHVKAIFKHFEVHTRVELITLLLRQNVKS